MDSQSAAEPQRAASIILSVGGAVEQFAREFAAAWAAAGVVATGFGRGAMWLALEAAGVRGGDVLIPNFICTQVVEAVRRAGAHPAFYPVGRDLEARPLEIAAHYTPVTRAAVIAHYYGRIQPHSEEFRALCTERAIPLIEDCALALGAQRDGCPAGSYGDLAVFSFTKSDWCYGGGLVGARSTDWWGRLRDTAEGCLHRTGRLCWWYGLLRRADFVANRPRLSRIAEHTGRWLERASGLGNGNFYDAGRFDASLPEFAARRARRILADLPEVTAQRQQILRRLTESLQGASRVLLRPQPDSGDAASFLLVVCPAGGAEQWVGHAERDAVTLRRCWPAYQPVEEGQASEDLAWLAEHLLLLEIHPWLTAREVARIAQTLRKLAVESPARGAGN